MAELVASSCRLRVAAGLVLASALGSCSIIPDTGSMDVDRFRAQTAPVYYDPATGEMIQVRPVVAGPNAVQPIPQVRDIYENTLYNQTFGLPVSNPVHGSMYGQLADDDFTVPAVPYNQIDSRLLRQEVDYPSAERPGTIVVDTKARYLYLVGPKGKAMRYGVGIGREGFAWSGRGVIQWKQKWPRWTPPAEMVSRDPAIKPFSAENGGMNPGPNNPLGARALYIYQNGKDTLYRVHGTPDWQSIGKETSSGCVRLLNQDVIDLYNRVPARSEIVVL